MIFTDFPEIGTRGNFDGVYTHLTTAVQKKISSRVETKESVVCPPYATWPAVAAPANVLVVANLSRLNRRCGLFVVASDSPATLLRQLGRRDSPPCKMHPLLIR